MGDGQWTELIFTSNSFWKLLYMVGVHVAVRKIIGQSGWILAKRVSLRSPNSLRNVFPKWVAKWISSTTTRRMSFWLNRKGRMLVGLFFDKACGDEKSRTALSFRGSINLLLSLGIDIVGCNSSKWKAVTLLLKRPSDKCKVFLVRSAPRWWSR